jgi:hypothetical protein
MGDLMYSFTILNVGNIWKCVVDFKLLPSPPPPVEGERGIAPDIC